MYISLISLSPLLQEIEHSHLLLLHNYVIKKIFVTGLMAPVKIKDCEGCGDDRLMMEYNTDSPPAPKRNPPSLGGVKRVSVKSFPRTLLFFFFLFSSLSDNVDSSKWWG